MSLGYVGQVKGVNRSDLNSHADACVVGKEALLVNYFDREVTVSGYDPSRDHITEESIRGAWICHPRNGTECAFDCTPRHLSPNVEAQPSEYHANEIA
jgi:hypothetical protein